MDNIVAFPTIKKMKQSRNPDVFIDVVLNNPVRLTKLREEREKALKKAKAERMAKEREKKRKQNIKNFALTFAVGVSFFLSMMSVYVMFIA